ncbi:hypothetical protein GCM10025883_12760 [Mobilicoccus caccae]|uniref:Uncharacterized protein n=1 Tax=Mobilicoccus caccae TaxID=1859295 RepID=A0ABQ6IP65_9MICO|nr:hypothetical protein GCM10025883_12760 [Mobilicoccus caccae]
MIRVHNPPIPAFMGRNRIPAPIAVPTRLSIHVVSWRFHRPGSGPGSVAVSDYDPSGPPVRPAAVGMTRLLRLGIGYCDASEGRAVGMWFGSNVIRPSSGIAKRSGPGRGVNTDRFRRRVAAGLSRDRTPVR